MTADTRKRDDVCMIYKGLACLLVGNCYFLPVAEMQDSKRRNYNNCIYSCIRQGFET